MSTQEKSMTRRYLRYALLPAAFVAGLAAAQYPILDMIADRAEVPERDLRAALGTPRQALAA
jgi:hypothetical protein